MSEKTIKSVHFHFHPNIQKETGSMCIEKAVNGKKRRYLEGVSSGLKEDAHKERMSEKCIKSFMDQANSGDILLYPDVHGIKQSEDIGILEKAQILDNGDWWTSYRLYDEDDDPGQLKLEKINALWKQANGLPPYTKKKQFGYSIEGLLYDGGIVTDQKGKTILDNIELDGVILTPRPAYMDSIANAVYKALDELAPWQAEKVQKGIQGKLHEIIQEKEMENAYWEKKYDINEALQRSVEEIMSDPKDLKRERLSIVFDEYRNMMIGLLLSSQELFQSEDSLNIEVQRAIAKEGRKEEIMKSISSELYKLISTRRK